MSSMLYSLSFVCTGSIIVNTNYKALWQLKPVPVYLTISLITLLSSVVALDVFQKQSSTAAMYVIYIGDMLSCLTGFYCYVYRFIAMKYDGYDSRFKLRVILVIPLVYCGLMIAMLCKQVEDRYWYFGYHLAASITNMVMDAFVSWNMYHEKRGIAAWSVLPSLLYFIGSCWGLLETISWQALYFPRILILYSFQQINVQIATSMSKRNSIVEEIDDVIVDQYVPARRMTLERRGSELPTLPRPSHSKRASVGLQHSPANSN